VKQVSKLIERLALIVLLIGGAGMLMSMFLGVADIVGTQVLLVPVPGPRELTESTMVLIVFGALAYAQIRRAHIRVEIFYLRAAPRTRAAMDVFTDICAIIFFSLLLLQQCIPEDARVYLGMMGFKVVVNYQGEVLRVEQPGALDDQGDE